MIVNILGTEWTILERDESEDDLLSDRDGYCDDSIKLIVVCKNKSGCEIKNYEAYKRECMRHEIIHAFMFESGLAHNMEHKPIGIEETMVDWFAIQYPKIRRVFDEVEV